MTQFLGVQAEGDDEHAYITAVSRLALIQAVARAKDPGCKADSVVIFEGEQGTGKSTALRILFSEEYFGDHLPHMTSKDACSYLKGKWGVELAELAYARKCDAVVDLTDLRQRGRILRNQSNAAVVLKSHDRLAARNSFARELGLVGHDLFR